MRNPDLSLRVFLRCASREAVTCSSHGAANSTPETGIVAWRLVRVLQDVDDALRCFHAHAGRKTRDLGEEEPLFASLNQIAPIRLRQLGGMNPRPGADETQ